MSSLQLYLLALELKRGEAEEKLLLSQLNLNLSKEEANESHLRKKLSSLQSELDNCTMPTSEEVERGDYRDEEKAKNLEEEISDVNAEISRSEQIQQYLKERIVQVEKRILVNQREQANLLDKVNYNKIIIVKNIDLCNDDVGNWNPSLAHATDQLTIVYNYLLMAEAVLTNNVNELFPSVKEAITNNEKKIEQYTKSPSSNHMLAQIALNMFLSFATGNIAGIAGAILSPIARTAIDSVFIQDNHDNDDFFSHFFLKELLFLPFRGLSFLESHELDKLFNNNYQPKPSYFQRTVENVFLGNYTDLDPTGASVGIDIGLALLNLDLPGDIRDLVYDLSHLESVPTHQVVLDTVAVLPIAGIAKKAGESINVGSTIAASTYEAAGGIIHLSKHADEATEAIQYFGKHADEATEAIQYFGKYADKTTKASQYFSKYYDDTTETINNLGKFADHLDDAGITKKTGENILGINADFGTKSDALNNAAHSYERIGSSKNIDIPADINQELETIHKVIDEDNLYDIGDITDDYLKDDIRFWSSMRKKNVMIQEFDNKILVFPDKSQTDIINELQKYGQDSVTYIKTGVGSSSITRVDLSPFSVISTKKWGKIDTNVTIGHMTTARINPAWEFGKRASKYDITSNLGNFEQADIALAEKLTKTGLYGKVYPDDIYKLRGNLFTWHEVNAENMAMQLVPTKIHDFFKHTGAVSDIRILQTIAFYSDYISP